MSDTFFWGLLGLEPGADSDAVRRAYHSLAKRNHPDFYPDERKARQEMKMMALNEAYRYLSRYSAGGSGPTSTDTVGAGGAAIVHGPEKSVGFHKDPAYAYYKQGFVSYSRAVHGIEVLYRSLTRPKPKSYKPRHETYERFSHSLALLKEAHCCFDKVVREYSHSMWKRDATWNLRRIERFSAIYSPAGVP